jgi:transcription elongation GreA/GreB family factor
MARSLLKKRLDDEIQIRQGEADNVYTIVHIDYESATG